LPKNELKKKVIRKYEAPSHTKRFAGFREYVPSSGGQGLFSCCIIDRNQSHWIRFSPNRPSKVKVDLFLHILLNIVWEIVSYRDHEACYLLYATVRSKRPKVHFRRPRVQA
jgi:hypothetical protein